MGRIILKPDRDVDFYVEWSTVVDNVTAMGSREGFLADPDIDTSDIRMERVDYMGTSARPFTFGPAFGSWEDAGFVVSNLPQGLGQRWLPRQNLAAFARAMLKMEEAEVQRLTEALPDD